MPKKMFAKDNGEKHINVDPRSFTEESMHELWKHNEHLMIQVFLDNLMGNYEQWRDEIPDDPASLKFMLRRGLKSFEKDKKMLDIVKLMWYAMCMMRYCDHDGREEGSSENIFA